MKKLFTLFTLCLLAIPLAQAADVTDIIMVGPTGVSGTNYTDWTLSLQSTNHYGINSSAVYSGNSAAGNSSIQLRSSNSTSGIVTTRSAGRVKSVTLVWNSNTADGRTVDVYGKNTAYTSPTNLYNNDACGDLLGSIVYGTSTTLTISENYQYIGLRSRSNALYLTSITIVWEDASTQRYTVSCNTADNGSIAASSSSASEGTTVTITGLPDPGYRLGSVTVTPTESGVAAPAVSVSGNTATFTMPASNVTVDATFTELIATRYRLVENASDLVSGAEYIIAGKTATATTYEALLGAVSSGNIGAAVKSGFSYDESSKVLTIEEDCAATPVILGGTTGAWTFHNGSGYLAYTSTSTSKDNYLFVVQSATSDGATWTIDGSKLPASNALVTNVYNNYRKLQYNNDRFCS